MPFDTVPHAGGQDLNRYIKEMAKEAEVKLVSLALSGEIKNGTVHRYGIDPYYVEIDNNRSLLGKILSINSKVNPWHKYGGIATFYKVNAILDKLVELKSKGYLPDIIIMQWTQITLFVEEIKQVFPNSKYVAVEVDVTYLRLKREYENMSSFRFYYNKIVYENEKKCEISALKKCDLIYVNNEKDRELLLHDGLNAERIRTLIPYFQKINVSRDKTNSDIMFYGNMERSENYLAAIWFIEKILPKISDKNVRFILVGAGAKMLQKYSSKRIIVTGYVPQIDPFFNECGLFVAPLMFGAGIKIKVLEAMYSGIPVITSDVGIEGIPAIAGVDYLLYHSENDLIAQIDLSLKNKMFSRRIGLNGKSLIEKNFNYETGIKSYIQNILGL